MRRYHPAPASTIPISLQVQQNLSLASCQSGYQKEDWEIVADAVDEWLRRHNPAALDTPLTSGYQWKRLFLPDGTLLRTVFNGKNHHCLVEGDGIVYDNKPVTPSGFVNALGGIRRNSWKSIWILFPNTTEWKLADALRPRAGPSRVRKLAAAATPEPAPAAPPSMPQAPSAEPKSTQQTGPAVTAEPKLNGAQRSWQPRSGTRRSAPAHSSDTLHNAEGHDQLALLLRQQLLPFLRRLFGPDGSGSSSGTSHGRNMAQRRAGRAQLRPLFRRRLAGGAEINS
jgi:hypothetical protein